MRLAIRASVGISSEEEERQSNEDAIRTEEIEDEFLLVETKTAEMGTVQAALPLADVLRIERIPRASIERIGHTPVLRFQGTLLPLEDSAGLLQQLHEEGAQMTVVVCRDGARHVGVAVSHVLDVAAGTQLAEAGTRAAAAGVTLLKERVTSVVNLSRIPPLPVPRVDAPMEVTG